jgi:hypothetical protein
VDSPEYGHVFNRSGIRDSQHNLNAQGVSMEGKNPARIQGWTRWVKARSSWLASSSNNLHLYNGRSKV